MAQFGINALTINSDTVAAAGMNRRDLWIEAREGVSMLILAPEQLISKSFRDLLAHEPFYDRVCVLGVDGIHLLVEWGLEFWKAFKQIVLDCALESLLLVLRQRSSRSNARHDIQILFRQLHSGIDGRKFPELAWVLRNQDKTLIFGRTISLVFRLKVYLNSLCLDDPHRDFRIRTHTGLNWPDDKEKTLADIANEPGCQIIIATNGLAQGNDIRVIETVIQVGEPESSEMYVQKPGRARPTVQDPRAIFYISATRMKLAAKIVQQTDGCLKCCGCSESSNQQEICPGDVSFGHRDTYGSVQACRAGPSIR
ncbi:hypothetical protein R3P38DRAFT_3215928 [Favolaschia claudopus]|uniref:DNA 3'-5' helicase n=1 Tax=Favolaschia claudopus TaxID=2862362 RepID=A0AAW0A7D0_9AGAR